jgi:hypothetical protein
MKKSFYVFGLCASLFLVSSCWQKSKFSTDVEGFEKIQKELMSKFGEKAYYTDINVINVPTDRPGGGVSLKITTTDNPDGLKMAEWQYSPFGGWQQLSDITIDASDDIDAKEFMFQLGDQFCLKKVGELVAASAKKLADEKKLEDAVVTSALLSTHDKPISEANIIIFMQPKNGGTNFTFIYGLDGNLNTFNY